MKEPIALSTVTPVSDKAPNWIKLTDRAAWRPRDAHGGLVFKNRMWIFGGWVGNYKPSCRDVWSSPNGKHWERVAKTAPWRHGDLPMTTVFKRKMWFMGGWCGGLRSGHSASNEVWCSRDGSQWQQVTKNAQWTPRLAAGILVFKGKMWILGGIEDFFFGDEKSVKNDVWCSADGKKWELIALNAGWSPRAFHQAVVFDDKMWIMGGGNFRPKQHALNDVWCSHDGVKWTRVTKAAAWPARVWFSSVVYRNRICVLGGWPQEATPRRPVNLADLWYSEDGKRWTELKSDVIWKARHAHATFVFRDKILVAGGCTGAGPSPLNSQVWSLHVPRNWFNDE